MSVETMRIKKGATNSLETVLPDEYLEMSYLSIIENELEFNKLHSFEKDPLPTFKIQTSSKIFKKSNSTLSQRSLKVREGFKPMLRILLLLGRFPFSPTAIVKDLVSPTYAYAMKTIHWIYFVLTSLFLMFVLVMITLGFVNFFFEWNIMFTKTKSHNDEKTYFDKNIVPFVLFWGCLVHITVGNLTFLINHKKIVNYFINWGILVDVVDIELPKCLKRLMIYFIAWVLLFAVTFIVFFTFDVAPIARGSSSLIANLVLRSFIPEIHLKDMELSSLSVFGIITLIYGIYGSRSLLFIYLFQTRLIRHTFKVWNGRLKEFFCNDDDALNMMEKLTCENLYRDHYILVRMVRQTDAVFGITLQAYYATQILTICFELYYLTRPGQFHSESSDIIVAAVLFGQTVSFFLTVSLGAALVNEEVMRGFEVLRSRGIRTDDSLAKKHFIYSLEMSYSQRIVLTGGKFFAIDKPFIVTVLGAVFTYFMIILQFGNQITSDPQEKQEK